MSIRPTNSLVSQLPAIFPTKQPKSKRKIRRKQSISKYITDDIDSMDYILNDVLVRNQSAPHPSSPFKSTKRVDAWANYDKYLASRYAFSIRSIYRAIWWYIAIDQGRRWLWRTPSERLSMRRYCQGNIPLDLQLGKIALIHVFSPFKFIYNTV